MITRSDSGRQVQKGGLYRKLLLAFKDDRKNRHKWTMEMICLSPQTAIKEKMGLALGRVQQCR